MPRSYWKPFSLLWLLCLAPLCRGDSLETRVADLEAHVEMMQLKLEVFDEKLIEMRPAVPMRTIRTKEELSKDLKLDATGEAKRKDKLASFPEVSTFVAWSNGRRGLVNGLGVELFHDRNKPRSNKWMFKLMLGDEWVGFSIGYILVPVINFNVGPFIGVDLEEDPITRNKETVFGLQASVFSF